MGAIAGIGQLVSGAGQAYGQYSAGQINKGTANANAGLADLNAVDASQRGDQAAGDVMLRERKAAGAARAAAGAAGVGVAAGTSASEALADTRLAGTQDMAQVRANAIREAFGFHVEAASSRSRGRMEAMGATNEALGTLATSGYKATKLFRGLRGSPPPEADPDWLSG